MSRKSLGAGGRSQDRTADSYRVKVIQFQAQGPDKAAFPVVSVASSAIRSSLKISAALVLAACAGTLPPDATPRQVAREECRTWLGQHNLSERPRRGTAAWDQLMDLCIARNLSAAGEIDRALEGVRS